MTDSGNTAILSSEFLHDWNLGVLCLSLYLSISSKFHIYRHKIIIFCHPIAICKISNDVMSLIPQFGGSLCFPGSA